VFLIYPGLAIFRLGADGFRAWFESPAMVREIGNAFISGGVAAALAWGISGLHSKAIRAFLAAPGLLGALMLGLIMLAGAQVAPSVMSSVAPWLFTLTLVLLPYALLLRLMIESGTQRAALHVARISVAHAVEWELWRERSIAAVLLLFCLGYSDFTVATLLAPPQFPTIFPRVFNLMHYGQSAVLSFTVFMAIAAPLACAALTLFLVRLYVRRRVR
jgi:ABC-type Fe3+ transport system permease subunit